MEPTFHSFLVTCGVTDTTQVVLEEESVRQMPSRAGDLPPVLNMSFFESEGEHFEKFVPKLKV